MMGTDARREMRRRTGGGYGGRVDESVDRFGNDVSPCHRLPHSRLAGIGLGVKLDLHRVGRKPAEVHGRLEAPLVVATLDAQLPELNLVPMRDQSRVPCTQIAGEFSIGVAAAPVGS